MTRAEEVRHSKKSPREVNELPLVCAKTVQYRQYLKFFTFRFHRVATATPATVATPAQLLGFSFQLYVAGVATVAVANP